MEFMTKGSLESTLDAKRDIRDVEEGANEASTFPPFDHLSSGEAIVLMLEYLRKLFTYDVWANREVLNCMLGLEVPPPRSVKWLAHILSAERLWLERLQHKKQTYPVWPEFALAQCRTEAAELAGSWKSYLDAMTEEGLASEVNYKNTKGEGFASKKQDILMHVVLHSAYHRGQIVADIRAAGFTPPYTDFIHAVRQDLVD